MTEESPTLPHAAGPEKAVLSVLMNHPDRIADIGLDESAFYLPAHRTLYREMKVAGADLEFVMFVEGLHKRGVLDGIGGPAVPGEICTYAPNDLHLDKHLAEIRECHQRREAIAHAARMTEAAHDRSDERFRDELAKAADVAKMATAPDSTDSMVRGFSTFPTDPLPENILAGNAWLRVGDVHFFNSSAGAGKSVALIQASMAWALGLPFLGIKPTRPLRILHFIGEDDESTLGQCREGFLENAVATFGREITPEEIASLDDMVRTDFSRQYTGNGFVARLGRLLADEPADLVLINPLLSYIGGDIVKEASEFLRGGIMPIMQRHRAGCLIAHHTCKLTKASWEEMDFTYSGIGGGEVANVPRSILTLAPTKVKGLHALYISKRPTTGWKDDDDKFTDHIFIKRTDNPSRPAWLPVSHEAAAAMIGDIAPAGSTEGRTKKVKAEDIVEAVRTGAMARPALLAQIQREKNCTESPAKNALKDARESGLVETFEQPTPGGGKPTIWVCLPEHRAQWVK